MKPTQQSAFTMVEIAIVFTIVGLLLSGLLVARELVRGAEVTRIIAEFEQINVAWQSFELQYGALPGDFDNAFAYWGTDCASTAGACNGDGDGNPGTSYAESRMFWRHLWLAGLVPFEASGNSSNPCDATKLYPSAAMDDAMYQIRGSQATYYGNVTSGLRIIFGGCGDTLAFIDQARLTPEQAWIIDTKKDNGVVYSGNYVAADQLNSGSVGSGCVVPTAQNYQTSNTPEYNIENDEVVCRMVYFSQSVY